MDSDRGRFKKKSCIFVFGMQASGKKDSLKVGNRCPSDAGISSAFCFWNETIICHKNKWTDIKYLNKKREKIEREIKIRSKQAQAQVSRSAFSSPSWLALHQCNSEASNIYSINTISNGAELPQWAIKGKSSADSPWTRLQAHWPYQRAVLMDWNGYYAGYLRTINPSSPLMLSFYTLKIEV